MKKMIAIVMALLIVGVTGVSAMAEEAQPKAVAADAKPTLLGAQNANRFKVNRMAALGNGIAISQSDPMDFELLRVGIAGLKMELVDEEAEIKIGIMYFGETKYRLKDVEIGEGTASANLYDEEGTQVGSISLDSYPKGDKEIWAGTLTIGDTTYNAYVIQAARKVKAAEKAAKALSYCKNNPLKCKAAMKAVGSELCDPEADDCRDKIKTFCESNPEDARCKRLNAEYCANNLDDADCRAEIMEKCKANFDDDKCEKLGTLYDKFVDKKPNLAAKAPAWLKNVRAKVVRRANAALDSNAPPGADTDDTDGGE